MGNLSRVIGNCSGNLGKNLGKDVHSSKDWFQRTRHAMKLNDPPLKGFILLFLNYSDVLVFIFLLTSAEN